MGKKTKFSGRPRGFSIDADVIKTRIQQRALSYSKLAEEATRFQKFPTNASAYSRAITNQRASAAVIEALCIFLDVLPDEFVTDEGFTQGVKQSIIKSVKEVPRFRRTQERSFYRNGQMALPVQDAKNVIRDLEVSNRLLATESPPSLYEAVLASKMQLSEQDDEKDRPPGHMDVNHFLSVGAVLTVQMPGDAKTYAVVVHRQRDKFPGDYQHTYGRSVLIGASFSFGLRVTTDMEMEEWVYRVDQDPGRAEDLFMKPPGAALLGLLAHKYSPYVDHTPKITPLGLVTRDERVEPGESHRIYSMYVFRIHTKLDRPLVPRDRFAQDVLVKPEVGSLVPLSPANESLWVRAEGKRNLMDVVAWRGLLGRERVEQEGGAHFVRGFALA